MAQESASQPVGKNRIIESVDFESQIFQEEKETRLD